MFDTANDISLDESRELFFSYEALNLLTIKIAPDIQHLNAGTHSFDSQLDMATSYANVTLADGRSRGCTKSARGGEVLPTGEQIQSLVTAANIADSRAARAVLRMVAFDPVREFENYLHSASPQRYVETISQLEKDRRYIHKVKDDLDMDNDTYRTHLRAATGERFESTEKMNEVEMSRAATHFRGVATANELARRRAA